MTTVLVADDALLLRALLRISLEEHGFEVVAEAPDGVRALELALEHQPDLCVLDVQMPGGDGLEAVAAISRALPNTRCVMLSASEDDEHLLAALRGGAAGFLAKGIDPDRLVEALRGVLRGEAALARKRTMRVLDELRVLHDTSGRHVMELTDEECALILRHRRQRHA